MMKKLLSCLLLASILCTALPVMSAFAEDDPQYEITPILVPVFNFTAAEWYESESSRALFAVSAWLDIALEGHPDVEEIIKSALIADSIYIGKDGLYLCLLFFGEENTALVTYSSATEEMEAGLLNNVFSSPEFIMMSLVSSDDLTSYYQVTKDSFLDATEVISALLE